MAFTKIGPISSVKHFKFILLVPKTNHFLVFMLTLLEAQWSKVLSAFLPNAITSLTSNQNESIKFECDTMVLLHF